MDRDSDRVLSDELEVAQARMEGLLEDERDQHDISFEDLNNIEVLTLASALNYSREHFAANGAKDQAHFVQGVERHLQEQADSLFEELRDIHEPVIEESMSGDSDQSASTDESSQNRWHSPFVTIGSDDITHRAWRFGGFLMAVQALVVIANTVWALESPVMGTSTEPVIFHVLIAIAGFLATAVLSFSVGVGYAKHRM